ncbi:MAG: cbb3-type cytochrome c oxidase N-terminal domain-containing protein [Bacteroidota bacterium]|nr:cbb3-type cytochrome c oxidase N-terminal domain-containing protein [Bacteroidota bacterium]
MLLSFFKKSKNILRPAGILLMLGFVQPVWAAGPPAPSIFSNPFALTLIILMLLLLIIIGILANILLGAADIKLRKSKKNPIAPIAGFMLLFLVAGGNSLLAQNNPATTVTATAAASSIGGMSATAFYIMASVIFLELIVIIVLLVNIKFLLKAEKKKAVVVEISQQTEAEKKPGLSWWDRFNKLRPVTQESELDLGHDYDGIRELNNRLPPWWLYGFYLTIAFAVVYLWRYHVSHSAPLSKEEFENSVARADLEVKEYLKMKGDNVDENTVTLLTDPADIEAGKAIFTNPMNCVTCHRADAGGLVGPNLTDDYWIYGGNIKDLFRTIKYGTNKGMKSWKDDLSAKQIAQVASYVKSLHGTNPANPKAPQGELYKEEAVMKPAADSIKALSDSVKAKDNKVAMQQAK